MKGDYVKSKPEHRTNMFSKPHQHLHSYHLSRNSSGSDDTSLRTNGGEPSNNNLTHPIHKFNTNTNTDLISAAAGSGDGATIEVPRRPRGRPPGSKNKPRAPVFLTRETEPPMSPYILEITTGNDVVEGISNFCRRKGIGICIVTASGSIANLTLRQSPTNAVAAGSIVTFHGRFEILSLSATFLPFPPPQAAGFPPLSNEVSISVAGPQGQIVGGFVAGSLIAAGSVYVIAASFGNPSYHRLTGEDEVRNSLSSGAGEGNSPPESNGGGQVAGGGESCGNSMYNNCQIGNSDVIWAPAARLPPPPY